MAGIRSNLLYCALREVLITYEKKSRIFGSLMSSINIFLVYDSYFADENSHIIYLVLLPDKEQYESLCFVLL